MFLQSIFSFAVPPSLNLPNLVHLRYHHAFEVSILLVIAARGRPYSLGFCWFWWDPPRSDVFLPLLQVSLRYSPFSSPDIMPDIYIQSSTLTAVGRDQINNEYGPTYVYIFPPEWGVYALIAFLAWILLC